jgi:acetolactate synthase-1/2/3 large subunit
VVLAVPEDVAHGEHDFAPAEFEVPSAPPASPPARAAGRGGGGARGGHDRARRAPMLLVGGGVHLGGRLRGLRAAGEGRRSRWRHTISGKGALACSHR